MDDEPIEEPIFFEPEDVPPEESKDILAVDPEDEPPDVTINDENTQATKVVPVDNTNAASVTNSFCVGGAGDVLRPLRRAAASLSPVGQASQPLLNADLNGDGVPDTAVVSGSSILVTLRKADGSVLSSSYYNVPNGAQQMAAGDFNGDGSRDLAVTAEGGSAGSVSILLNNGDGTFREAQTFSTPGGASAIALADFNRDGKLDVATLDFTNGISLLFGNGDGTLRAPIALAFGSSTIASSLLAADLNSDGITDLAVVDNGSTVYTLLGKGDGTFQTASAMSTGFPQRPEGGYLGFADFNHDGKLDLLIAWQGTYSLSLLLGKGDGTFQPPANYATGGDALAAFAILPLLDETFAILTPDQLTGGINVTFTRGDGTLGNPPLNTASDQTTLGAMTTANLGGSKTPEIVALGQGSGAPAVDVFPSSAPPAAAPVEFPLPVHSGAAPQLSVSSQGLAAGDLNGDGNTDIVAVNSTNLGIWSPLAGGQLDVLLGNGNQTLSQAREYPAGLLPAAVVLADFNGDGKLDAAVADTGDAGATPSSNPGGIEILFGNGDGTFQNAVAYGTAVSYPYKLVAADFNGDGKPDLAAIPNFNGYSFGTPANVAILLNKGDGTFRAGTPAALGPTPGFPYEIAAGDLNGDGKPDLAIVAASFAPGSSYIGISTLLGNGDGTFRSGPFTKTKNRGQGLALADLNGDGNLDLVTTYGSGDTIYLLGNGDGSFQPEQYIQTSTMNKVAITDFNGDGKPDLALAGATNTAMALLNNFGAAPVTTTVTLTNGASYATGAGAPNTIITGFGSFPGCTSGAQVTVDGNSTLVFYSLPVQLSFQLPPGVSGEAAAQIQIQCSGTTATASLPIAAATPAIFTANATGTGQAAVVNQDGTVNTPTTAGNYIQIYGTGFGLLAAPSSDGLSRTVLPVSATIGGQTATVLYAGEAPGYAAGLQQVNILVPPNAPKGSSVPLILTVGNVSTQSGVTLNIQ